MREIKFRAWDKKNNKWLEDTFLINCDGAIVSVFEKIDAGQRWYALFVGLDVEIMQFTGLTEKDGKEIYEGDIVKLANFSGIYQVMYGNNFFNCGQFYLTSDNLRNPTYRRKTFRNELLLNACGYFMDNSITSIEIIGNIYENPELLT